MSYINTYLVLAGGFWNASRQLFNGRQVNPQASGFEKHVDYIIKINGLPDGLFVPEGYKSNVTFYCKEHERDVLPVEIEARSGCFLCKPSSRVEKVELWNDSILQPYSFEELEYIKPCYRIWCNNEQGLDKIRSIIRFCEQHYPANQLMPMAVPIGDRVQLKIKRDTIPVVFLDTADSALQAEEAKTETKKNKFSYICSVCNAFATVSDSLLAQHMKEKHAPKETLALATEKK